MRTDGRRSSCRTCEAVPRSWSPSEGRLLRRVSRQGSDVFSVVIESGLERLVQALAQKMGVHHEELLLIVAHPESCLGDAIRRFTRDRPVSRHAVVLPELARDLDAWIERLALTGPVEDCTDGESGLPVLLIDELGEMALTRLSV